LGAASIAAAAGFPVRQRLFQSLDWPCQTYADNHHVIERDTNGFASASIAITTSFADIRPQRAQFTESSSRRD